MASGVNQRKTSTVIESLKTMNNLIRFLSLLCVFDIYQQNMLEIDECDKEIK